MPDTYVVEPTKVATSRPADYVLSTDGSRLYVAGTDGVLNVYDTSDGLLVSSSKIGQKLGSIDLSPDGSFVLMTERVPVSHKLASPWWDSVTESAVYKVDLDTGVKTTYISKSFGSDYVLADVAIMNDGTAYFSRSLLPGWSGGTNDVAFDPSTGKFEELTRSYYQDGALITGSSRDLLLHAQLFLSSAELYLVDPETGTTRSNGIYENDVYGYAAGIQAYSVEANMIAMFTGGALHVYDGTLKYLVNLSGKLPDLSSVAGIAFDPSGDSLYVVDAEEAQILRIATADWSVAQVIDFGGDISFAPSAWGNELLVGPDAAFFVVLTETGVLQVANPIPSSIVGTAENDVLDGNGLNNVISGLLGDDRLNGGAGNDLLDGGLGADRLTGGQGNDTYIVDNVGDVVVELAGGGTDKVRASISHALVANVETLVLTGAVAIDGTGNALANTIVGNEAANRIDGQGGADLMQGRGGDDTYVVDDASDRVREKDGEGIDVVESSVSFSLAGQFIEKLVLAGTAAINGSGNGLDNTLIGNDGANRLDGGAGADVMAGRGGDDTYVVDNIADKVVELLAAGIDIVNASVTYSLAGQHVEVLNLTGAAAINGFGNGLDNYIAGNAAANVLHGGAGNDRIDGGRGADTMTGGLGNDRFVVDDAADTVSEKLGEGSDTIEASVSYSLSGQFVETLKLIGNSDINATGNNQENSLFGNDGANLINGMGGADWMAGGLGNDRYVVDDLGDKVLEAADAGTDTVDASVSYSLAGQYVETLRLTGTSAINGTGNNQANSIYGNTAANSISAAGGDDKLFGGDGNDTLTGGAGLDRFIFDTALDISNVDKITDFNVADDSIYLGKSVFSALALGTLASTAFVEGSAALDPNDRILYDKASGSVFYDADGAGAGSAVLFATVNAGTLLTNADFIVA